MFHAFSGKPPAEEIPEPYFRRTALPGLGLDDVHNRAVTWEVSDSTHFTTKSLEEIANQLCYVTSKTALLIYSLKALDPWAILLVF